jgi:hypothetical protein
MRLGAMSVLVLMAVAGTMATTAATADVRIGDDRGGALGAYLLKFAEWRKSGERVVIDGRCLSACTLVLGLVPPHRICVTPRAVFGFHATWIADTSGMPVRSRWSTRTLLQLYPEAVRQWIVRHGGLSEQMIYLTGAELAALYPSCH